MELTQDIVDIAIEEAQKMWEGSKRVQDGEGVKRALLFQFIFKNLVIVKDDEETHDG